jgi:hypothetical protein
MKEQLIEKEADVVYVLTLSRKLLENQSPARRAAVRAQALLSLGLARGPHPPQETLPFLERVDRFAESVLSGNTDVVEEHRMFREFLFLDTFKEQFRQFLKAYDLPVDVCDNENRWHGFLRLYAGIIEDGSLSCEAKNSGLRLVNEVTFSKKSAGQKGQDHAFRAYLDHRAARRWLNGGGC